MAVREETKGIEDSEGVEHKYFCRQLPPTKALPLKYELTKALGSILPSLLAAKGGTDKSQARAMGHAIENMFDAIGPERVTEIIKMCIETATRDGERIKDGTKNSFDIIYSDEYKEMYQAFFFVLEVNYGNFIKGFGLNLETIKEKATKALLK